MSESDVGGSDNLNEFVEGDDSPGREELQAELPMDWDDLKEEVLVRDDGECVVCGTGAGERQLYVLYRQPPDHMSRVHPAVSESESDEIEVEVPGFGVGNMGTVCEVHTRCENMDPRTVVVPDEAREARNKSEVSETDSGVGGEPESGFDRESGVGDGTGAVGFPEKAGSVGDGDEAGSRFGMGDEFSAAKNFVSGSDDEPDEPYIVPEDEGGVGGDGTSVDADGPVGDEHVEREVVIKERKGGDETESEGDGTGADDGSGGVAESSSVGEGGLVRSRQQRSFGYHLPFIGRTLRVVRVLVAVAVSVSITGGILSGVVNGSTEAAAATALTIGGGFVDALSTVFTSPLAFFAVFGTGYALHLWFRDGAYSEWPMIRESPSPSEAGRRLIGGAGVTTLLSVGVVVFGGFADLGEGAASLSVTGFVVACVYVVGVVLTMKVMGDAVVADRKAGAASNAFAWEMPVRVGGVVGMVVAIVGTVAPSVLSSSVLSFAPVGMVAGAAVLVAPLVGMAYAVRRRAWPTTHGVPVTMDTSF